MVELPRDEVNSLFGREGSRILEGRAEGTGPEGWQALLDLAAEDRGHPLIGFDTVHDRELVRPNDQPLVRRP